MRLRPTNKLYPLRWSSLVLVLALGACGDDSGDDDDGNNDKPDSSVNDAGRDSSTGPGLDASTDASAPRDATVADAGDASTSIPDASLDASTDAATSDTGVPDAGGDTILTLNGCAPANYMDLSGTGAAVITFGGQQLGNNYSPKCATINVGQTVRFVGNFQFHPLDKGTPSEPNAGSANNPITNTTSGQMKEFTFTAAGTYAYHCTAHTPNMVGAIHVK